MIAILTTVARRRKRRIEEITFISPLHKRPLPKTFLLHSNMLSAHN
jgi:hypothetical protein